MLALYIYIIFLKKPLCDLQYMTYFKIYDVMYEASYAIIYNLMLSKCILVYIYFQYILLVYILIIHCILYICNRLIIIS